MFPKQDGDFHFFIIISIRRPYFVVVEIPFNTSIIENVNLEMKHIANAQPIQFHLKTVLAEIIRRNVLVRAPQLLRQFWLRWTS